MSYPLQDSTKSSDKETTNIFDIEKACFMVLHPPLVQRIINNCYIKQIPLPWNCLSDIKYHPSQEAIMQSL